MADVKRRANGEGCFLKTPSGKVMLRKCIGVKTDGKPYIVTVTADTKQECLRRMKEKESVINVRRNKTAFVLKITLAELCYEHLAEHMSQRDRIKPTAADRRECTIRNQIEPYPIGSTQCGSVKSADVKNHIERLIDENKLSVSSIKKCFDVINSAYNWAISQEALSYNPCTKVCDEIRHRLSKLEDIDSDDEDVIVMSEEEKKIFYKEADKLTSKGTLLYPIAPYAKLLMHTGIRVGELCALRWKNYDMKYHTLDISRTRFEKRNRDKKLDRKTIADEGPVKNYHARVIELNEEAIEVLEGIHNSALHTEPEDYILINRNGKPMAPDKATKPINTIFKNAGLGHISGAHVFRRTFATDMYDSGASIKSIAGYLGDLESTVSKHYIAVRKKVRQGDKVRNVVLLPKPADSSN